MNYSAEQIIALAPDAASAKAGRSLATSSKWQNVGRDERALWGECQGSGAKPYQTVIDLSEPAFKCTCPSRKFPCKHALGLFLLVAEHPAPNTTAPAWAAEWLAKRDQQAQRRSETRARVVVGVARQRGLADLFEGGKQDEMLKRAATLVNSGIQLLTLLALDDKGAPGFNQQLASKLAAFGIPCFACSPDVFPDLMAAAIERRNINQWAAERNIVVAR